jgi:hypothetical protein
LTASDIESPDKNINSQPQNCYKFSTEACPGFL